MEERIDNLILGAVPKKRRALLSKGALAHVLMMAQDGFSMNVRINPSTPCSEETIELFCDLILGTSASARS